MDSEDHSLGNTASFYSLFSVYNILFGNAELIYFTWRVINREWWRSNNVDCTVAGMSYELEIRFYRSVQHSQHLLFHNVILLKLSSIMWEEMLIEWMRTLQI